MAIQGAIDFLSRVQSDSDFRKSCYAYSTKSELLEKIEQQGYCFSEWEFENAINHLLLMCSEESQACELRYLQSWFMLFR